MEADRLTAFLYLLMRDHVPTGTVKQLVAEVSSDEFDLSAPELGALAQRYAAPLRDVIDAGVGEDDDDEQPEDVVEAITVDGTTILTRSEEEIMSPAMVAFIDLFDDRILSLDTFAQAVNEAAENERPADEDTARIVAARARELAEAKGN